MIAKFYNYIYSINYMKPIINFRFRLFVYWHTRSKIPLVIVSIVVLVSSLLVSLIYSSRNDVRITKDITCLALNVYHEARGEPKAGQYAVARVTLNRAKSKHYPNDICDVVFQKNWDKRRQRYVSAFSWTELDSRPSKKSKTWQQAWDIAESAYTGTDNSKTREALFYHANYIRPSWSRNKKPVARIGKHIFYN